MANIFYLSRGKKERDRGGNFTLHTLLNLSLIDVGDIRSNFNQLLGLFN